MARKKSNKNTLKSNSSRKKKKVGKPLFTIPNFSFVKGERFRNISALALIVFGLFTLIAFTSFLSNWQDDQNLVVDSWWDYLTNKDIQAKNALGKLGALIGHATIFKGIGLGAYIITFLCLVFGVKAISKTKLINIPKILSHSFFFLVWTPVFLGYFFESIPVLGGVYGFESNLWLSSILGGIGAGISIMFMLLVYMVIVFNINMEKVLSFIGRFKKEKKEVQVAPENNVITDPVTETISETIALNVEAEDNVNEIIDDLVKDINTTSEPILFETEEDSKIAEPIDNSNDSSEFSVEIAAEDDVLSDSEVNKKVKEFGEYDPTLDLASFQPPSIDLLVEHGDNELHVSKEELEENKNKIVQTLANYKIGIAQIKATIGPTVTLYEIIPEAGVRISKIKNLEDDIALSLAALGIRIIAPIPGKGTIGIEVPNSNPDIVSMKTLIASEKFQNTDMALPVVIGKTISNETYVFDLSKMPHLLMAGATGQGKSVGLNALLVSLLYKKHPSQIKFVLVDPKKVELTLFNKIERHYLAKLPDEEDAIITDTSKVVKTLNSLCIEMDDRYELLKKAEVRNLKEYNHKFINRKLNPEKGHRYLPYIVLVVDEFADLIMTAGKEVETPIARLAQLARAIGIHLIIATQRPSVNILTGTIKANFPARIAFRVTSKVDSRTILDSGGADQLIGRGDMLLSTGSELIRLQCGFVDTPEVEKICEFIGNQRGYPEAFLLPEYVDESSGDLNNFSDEDRDVMFEDAARVVVMHQQGSTSLIQRKLKLGYNRAGRIMDQLEAAGIVGPFKGSKAREVLFPDEYSLEQYLNRSEPVTED